MLFFNCYTVKQVTFTLFDGVFTSLKYNISENCKFYYYLNLQIFQKNCFLSLLQIIALGHNYLPKMTHYSYKTITANKVTPSTINQQLPFNPQAIMHICVPTPVVHFIIQPLAFKQTTCQTAQRYQLIV